MRMTTRGRLTIPKHLRERYGIQKGDEVQLIPVEYGIRIEKLEKVHPIQKMRGILKPKPTDVFTEGPGANTRDAMLLRTGGLWRVYYTAFHGDKGYVFSRTSPDLKTWSGSFVVAYGGQAGNNIWSCECPFVVELSPGHYYLFRTQVYGRDAKTSVYHSTNPGYFGIDDDRGFVGTLPVAAPEILLHEGQYYIAALMPDLNGIRIARLQWEP